MTCGLVAVLFFIKKRASWGCSPVGSMLAENAAGPGFPPQHHIKLGVMRQIYCHSAGEEEANGSENLVI